MKIKSNLKESVDIELKNILLKIKEYKYQQSKSSTP